jgi:DNA-binding HxlR family transcriptional regulator
MDRNETPSEMPPHEPFVEAMQPLRGKWKIEILWALARKTRRFGELRRELPGITQHMLSLRLRELEADGLVVRTAYDEAVLRVEYEISEAARGLKPVFQALLAWSERYGPLSRQRGDGASGKPDKEIAA